MVEVTDIINSHSESDEGPNCNMEDLYFVVDDEEMPDFYDEEDERNFMVKDWKCESWEEVVNGEQI